MDDFTAIMTRMLAAVPGTHDKREGSIIYNALAPAAAELAQAAINLEIWKDQTYLLTATGDNLDNRGGDFAIARFPATNAQRIAQMTGTKGEPADVTLGSRFTTPNEQGGLVYEAVEKLSAGRYVLQALLAGTSGNDYIGDILPLFIDNRLSRAAITGTQVPARDLEPDEDYRVRIIARMSQKAFGGNVADYKRFVQAISGVGGLKVFPVWNGGGTVLLSVLDAHYDSVTPEFLTIIKNMVDPAEETGLGIGTAPIGHTVKVMTPAKRIFNVEATVTLNNRTVGQIQAAATQRIADYFLSVRKAWADASKLSVFNIAVANAIYGVDGVVNVQNVKLNGATGDFVLTETPQQQELPYVGTVTLREP